MRQSEVDFKVKSYLTKDDYEKDGCPVQYFEFDKHEYYGLVAVKTVNNPREQAYSIYAEEIAGDSTDEVKQEGEPNLISKSEALLKFLLAEDNKQETVEELINQFTEFRNGTILIDYSLM